MPVWPPIKREQVLFESSCCYTLQCFVLLEILFWGQSCLPCVAWELQRNESLVLQPQNSTSTPPPPIPFHPVSHPLPFTLLSLTLCRNWPWSLSLNLSRASYYTMGSRDHHTCLLVTPVRGYRLLQTYCFDLFYFNSFIKTYLGLWKSIFKHNGITWLMVRFCRKERVCARETAS